jgi:glycosyltransferase involved in cell wall biosynthesis
MAARLTGKKVVRTRHLSTHIKGGLNGRLLYKGLADFVVTTSSCIIPSLSFKSGSPLTRLRCIATGVAPQELQVEQKDVDLFRQMLTRPGEILIGTACFVRSWKGILDLLKAAQIVKKTHPFIKWVVVGGGYYKEYLSALDEMDVRDVVTFTGHLESPYAAIKAFDVFTLLSTAHEGISQASLQAAFLGRPLITTDVGGLPEVCIDGKTGFVVQPRSPAMVAEAVIRLATDPLLRDEMGRAAKALVEQNYTMTHTLDQMEKVYSTVLQKDGCFL